jgi:O-antigen ligase
MWGNDVNGKTKGRAGGGGHGRADRDGRATESRAKGNRARAGRTTEGRPPFTYKHALLYAVILFAMVFQGGYFTVSLLVLDMALILWLILDRRPVRWDIGLFCMSALFGIMAVMAVFRSVDGGAALHELLKYALFPLSYAVFASYREDRRLGAGFDYAFALLMAAGLLAVMGFSLFAGMTTIQGNRLQSFLQYANTTALFMGIGALLALDRLIVTRRRVHAVWLVLFAAAMLLTQSRTTFVVFVLVLLLYAFSRLRFRIGLAVAAGAVGTAAAVVAFGGRLSRISLLEPTLVERLLTFRDALKIVFVDTHGLGLGPGSWQYLQFSYQSAPYQVRYVHNFLLQVALDGGAVALLLAVGWLAFHLVRGWKATARSVHFFEFVFILLHSLLEVDFQFGIVILYFTYLLTQLHPPVYWRMPVRPAERPASARPVPSGSGAPPRRLRIRWLLVLPLALLLGAFGSEISLSMGDAAAGTNPAEAERMYKTALRWNPLNRDALFKLAKLERNADRAIAYLEDSFAANPYDYQVLTALAQGYMYKQDFDKSYFYADRLFHIFPYSREHQELVRQILQYFYDHTIIPEETFRLYTHKLNDEIRQINDAIHPLYRYIDPDLAY